jgi:hypothetical protein
MPVPALESGLFRRLPCRLAYAVALFAAVAGGYAGAQTNHPVTLTVQAGGAPPLPAGTCTTQHGFVICVSEDPIDLTNDVEPVIITWKLTSTDWSFNKNKGIVIKKGKWKISEKSGAEYAATQKKDGLIYKYTINLTNGAGGTTLSWDPTIKNN